MYKRKKRRGITKGKKKLSTSPPSSPGGRNWSRECAVTEAPSKISDKKMSVTAVEVTENHLLHHHHHHLTQRQPIELTTSANIHHASNNNNKAVGARKRKPVQISKIVDKLRDSTASDHALDLGVEKNLVNHNNNNTISSNTPPYKKPCLEMSKNGMIKSILTELKSAKMGRGDTIMPVGRYGDEDCDDEDEEDRSEDDCDSSQHHKNDADAEDEYEYDEDEACLDFSAKGVAKLDSKKRNLYANPLHDKYGMTIEAINNHHNLTKHQRDKVMDLSEIKSILSANNGPTDLRTFTSVSPNGWDRKYNDEDDSANDEGADFTSITGNVVGDDELPFRCGVCTYGSCDKSTLLRHMRTHSGERPFQCRLCYFAFTTKANCERHLRNRHGQIDRDQLRNLVVCLPTSSNASESDTEVASNGGSCAGGNGAPLGSPPAVEPTNLVMASVESSRKRAAGVPAPASVAEERELPLDLSMDAVDLSTKSKDGNPIFRRKASLPRPRPIYPSPAEMPNSIVTSPFVTKREPLVHPQLPLNAFAQHPVVPAAPIVGAPPSHPAFNIFSFGGPPGFNPFVMQPTNVEKLINLGSTSPPKLPTPFLSSSGRHSYESRDVLSGSEKDLKVKSEEISEVRKSSINAKSAVTSVSPTSSTRKRDNSSGEYQKPKQRRYRTERPFACPHCPARFTLRSNMERHGKHQHPTVWQRSPSNRVINRQKNQQLSPLVGSPTMVHSSKYASSNGSSSDIKEKNRDLGVNVNVRAVIAQQLKRKLSNSSLRNNNNGSETETDPENTPVQDGKISGGDSTSDLASVSQLLDRAKNNSFAQYFNEAENVQNEDDNNSEDDGEEESGEEILSSEEGDIKATSGEKKKSAYSSAPHKISCPHCTRRFPWTSSLRRHLLTHTGQKPFQCSKCPLLFTTKSNCDRHLARKHGGGSSKIVSDSNNSSEEDEGGHGENSDTTNEPDDARVQKTPASEPSKISSNSVKTSSTNGSATSSPGEDAAFRCHLCEAAAGEREALLAHMEEQHKDTFHLLVSKGALSSSPPSENSENEQIPLDQRDVTHRKVMCVFCVRRFWSVEDLRRHIRSHSGERPFSCPHCSRRFTLKHSMLRHLKKHSQSGTPSRKFARGTGDQVAGSRTGLVRSSNSKNGDLIGRLLGLNDEKLVEKLLSQPDAKDAAKLLGIAAQQQQSLLSTPIARDSSKVSKVI